GTPLTLALRDCGIVSIAIVGIATEVGIEPTARHAADLCFIPVIIADACGAGDEVAAQRSLEALRFAGDSIITDTETFTDLLRRACDANPSHDTQVRTLRSENLRRQLGEMPRLRQRNCWSLPAGATGSSSSAAGESGRGNCLRAAKTVGLNPSRRVPSQQLFPATHLPASWTTSFARTMMWTSEVGCGAWHAQASRVSEPRGGNATALARIVPQAFSTPLLAVEA